jgi:hypothetical protein
MKNASNLSSEWLAPLVVFLSTGCLVLLLLALLLTTGPR